MSPPLRYYPGVRALISMTTKKCSVCMRPGVQRVYIYPAGLHGSLGPAWRCERHRLAAKWEKPPSERE